MKVAIRTDASLNIGSGHLMRCLCLANALRSCGAEVQFLCRELPEHLQRLVSDQGHALVPLQTDSEPDVRKSALAEQAWSRSDQIQDADISLASLAGAPFDWLVLDHYGLGRIWEARTGQSATMRLMVIDDLAREHDCDVLLDQNFHPDAASRYRDIVPKHCQQLLGPRYALLRPEFQSARQRVLPREGEVRRVLIFMGGMDANNTTQKVLNAVAMLERSDLTVNVVIGQTHPAREAIQSRCQSMPNTHCHVQTDRMADLLAETDLAIGAGGSATWERCALGVPTLTLCLAPNQRDIVFNCARQGLVYAPDSASSATALSLHLKAMLDNSGLRHFLSHAGMNVVDALGANRVVKLLSAGQIKVRQATVEDSIAVHSWRNAAGVRAMSRNNAPIPLAEHQRWFEKTLRNPTRHLLIGDLNAIPVGAVRFDIQGGEATVSIFLCPDRVGQGLGPSLLHAAERWLERKHPEITALQADTLAKNLPSRRLFESCGYQLHLYQFAKAVTP
jgi:UDP-2,4-diacetamido-2,4,6-trideoxy-beta-L-altropyranose hydrolase